MGGVYWVSMSGAASVMRENALCEQWMAGVGADYATLDVPAQVQRVLACWHERIPRLLIFDNCEDPALLTHWQPPTGGCRVLVTSRCRQWVRTRGMQKVALATLPCAQSIELLLEPDHDNAHAPTFYHPIQTINLNLFEIYGSANLADSVMNQAV